MTDGPNRTGTPQDLPARAVADPVDPGPPIDLPTVAAMSLVVYAVGIAMHEWSHAAAAWMVGGVPALISSTDMRADVSEVRPGGLVWIAAAGSAANLVLAILGLGMLHAAGSSTVRVFGWLVAAVNGFVASVYLIASPLIGFGDWMTAISKFDHQAWLRLVAAAFGVLLTAGWVALMSPRLMVLLRKLTPRDRAVSAPAFTRTVWMTGGVLGVLAGLFSPLGLGWAVAIGAGSTLGTTWPLLPMGRLAGEAEPGALEPGDRADALVPRSPGWLIAGAVVGALFVLTLGRGIPL